LEFANEGDYFVARGPESMLEHGQSFSNISAVAGIDDRAKSFIEGKVATIMHELLTQNYYSNLSGASILTNRSIDIEALEVMSGASVKAGLKRAALSDAFAHIVPNIEDATPRSLIDMRNKEGEAFQVYRDALTRAIDEALKAKDGDYDSIFMDIVEPELHKLKLSVRNSRALLKRDIGRDIAFGAAILTIGIFGGIVPWNIAQIGAQLLALLGTAHVGKDIATKVLDLLNEPPSIRENNFYFLWKIQSAGKNWRG
jgi:hypothetical protein